MKTSRLLLSALFVLLTALGLHATIGAGLQMQLGNPSGATVNPANHTNYLIERPQYAMDYSDTLREPNWVSWNLTSNDVGGSGRSDDFFVDTSLPAGFYQVLTTDYSGSGYDRGHMCPSADRTISRADNDVTFFMSNMVPQTPDNNRGIWANFETYCRTLASAGNEVLITTGTSGFAGSTVPSGVAIPGYTWKVVVVVPLGPGSAVDRIIAAGASAIRVIAIKVPNISGISGTPWQNFVTSAAQIQADTGFTFFTALPGAIASALRPVVDGSSPVGSPVITTHPTTQTTVVGGSATFSVAATGDAPLSYQWLHEDVDIPGATGASLTLSGVQAANVGTYYVVVTNNVGSTTSNAASLIVTGLPPVITAPPVGQTVTAGANVTFSVTATGSPILTYQWRKNSVPIGGATGSTLTLTNVQAGDTAGYDVVVTNSTSSAFSAVAALVVNDSLPVITTQPVSRTAVTAENAGFTVVATGTAPLTYQWRKDGSPISDGGTISGTTTASLLIAGVTAVNGGAYDVVITNALGSATSSLATLLVNPPPPSTVFWDFGPAAAPTASPTSGLSADITGGLLTRVNNNGTTDPMINTTSASTGSGASGANNAAAATFNGALNIATSTYFQFTLTPGPGKRLLATGLQFRSRSTGTGPQALAVYSSLDGFAAPLATMTNTSGTNWALYTPAIPSLTGTMDTPITFRIYGYNGAGATGSTAVWRIDDLRVTLSAIFPPPVAPEVIATSPANGAANVPVANPITVTFNEAVSFTGSWFSINSAAAGPLTASVTGGPTTFSLATPSALPNNDTITVTILKAQVVDQASGTIHGTGNTTFSFTTEAYVPPTPPTVTGQPSAQTVNAGSGASFSVTATGTAPLNYQWRKNGTPISGNSSAVTATLTIAATALADMGSYDCVVSNVAGSDVSAAATLTVNLVPPAITTQPLAQMVGVGGNASFTVAATGTGPLSYQWRRDGTLLNDGGIFGGTHTATLTVTNVTDAQSGAYDVVVTNAAASATSNPAALVVSSAPPSVIYWDFATAAPTSGIPAGVTGGTVTQGNNNGTTVLLSTTSASTPTTTFSGGNNAGAAARIGTLNKNPAGSAYFEFTFTPDAGRQFAATALTFGARSTGTGPQAYSVFTSVDGYTTAIASGTLGADSTWRVITTPFAGVTSASGAPVTFRIYGHNGTGSPGAGTANWRIDDVRLTAGLLALPPVPPSVTAPADQTATVGDTVQFTVAASGTAPFSYQWQFAGVPITGNASAATATLILPVVTTADAGQYDCVVTNIAGTATSAAATLTVNKAVATVSLGTLDFVYSGAPSGTTATTAPTGLNVLITYDGNAAAPVNAGSYAVVATVDDANYTGTASGTLTITKAPATVTLGDLSQVYSGAPRTASALTTPGGLGVAFTYDGSATAPTNTGTYNVVGTIVDANHFGSASGVLTVTPAVATVTLGNLSRIYDGSPKAATVTTAPAGLAVSVTYNGLTTAPTNTGSYAVVATVNDANYTGSASGTLVINQGQATITLTDLVQAYDGTPKPVTVTTAPAGLAVTVTYNGSATVPTNPGSYAVVATSTDANHAGSASGTLVITVTALVRHAPTLNGGMDGSIQVLLPESITLNGSAVVSGDLLLPGTPTVQLNGQPVYGGTLDGTGSATPTAHHVTLNGKAVLRHVVRRTDAIAMPVVAAPPAPLGTRNVSLNNASETLGDFATLRNLTLNGNNITVTVPAGTYGTFTVNGNNRLILGVAGATVPSVYNFQGLTLNGNSEVQVVGPVIINLASGLSLNGGLGSVDHPEWLTLNLAAGGLTLNGNVFCSGIVVAPSGSVTLNGNSTLNGRVVSDRLTINGNGLLVEIEP
jgi:DNA/RNA endonuclease G (NUC1)